MKYWYIIFSCKRLLRDNTEANAIEMAIVFPVFALFLFGVLEMGIVMFGNAMIAETISNAALYSATGCTDGETDAAGNCKTGYSVDAASILQRISERSLGIVDTTKLCLISKRVMDWNADTTPDFSIITSPEMNLGASQETIVYYAAYKWPILFTYMTAFFGNDVNFQYITIVRNSAFGAIPNVTRLGPANYPAGCPTN